MLSLISCSVLFIIAVDSVEEILHGAPYPVPDLDEERP